MKSDNRYFEAAIAGQAKYIISNDHHLLEHDGYHSIRVMRPGPFLSMLKKGLNKTPESSEINREKGFFEF